MVTKFGSEVLTGKALSVWLKFIDETGKTVFCLQMQVKGQMNQKNDIFSFVPLPSPNTKKNHPKSDLGKDFSSQAFIER